MWTREPPWHKHLGGVEKLKVTFYVLFSLCLPHRLDSLKPRDLLEPDPQDMVPSMSGNLDFTVSPLR